MHLQKLQQSSLSRQSGVTLMEMLVAAVISIISVFAMVLVMSATLGSGTKTIQMTRLSQEMRTGMQVITRELRRANYHSAFLACYGNAGCLDAGSLNIRGQIDGIDATLDNSTVAGANDCLMFFYERPGLTLANSFVAAFRIDQDAGEGRTLQMSGNQAVDCSNDTNWIDITDPDLVDVISFTVENTGFDLDRDGTNDYVGLITETFNAGVDSQRVERLEITLTAALINDQRLPDWMTPGTDNVTERQITHFITVRNNTTTAGP